MYGQFGTDIYTPTVLTFLRREWYRVRKAQRLQGSLIGSWRLT